MPDARFHQTIEDRGDVDFPKRAGFMRTRRRVLMWVCGLLGFWPLLWQFTTGNQQIYWSHPVSPPHQLIASDCRACHAAAFQSVLGIFRSEPSWRSIEAETCRTCHAQHALDHHKTVVATEAETCFACHKEHQETADLLNVPDSYCIACHANLHTEIAGEIAESEAFAREIPSFREHPEFALRRTSEHESLARLMKLQAESTPESPPPHAALALAEWNNASVPADRTPFRFSHEHHLTEGGVPLPPSHPDDANRIKVLTCQNCHETDSAGQYMNPIRFEQHCQECHALTLANDPYDLARESWQALPHDRAALIQAILRDRLTHYFRERSEPPPAVAESPRLLPGNFPIEQPSLPSREAEWVEARLEELRRPGFLKGGDRALEFPSLAQLCDRCHVFQTGSAKDSPHWSVLAPNIPSRWYPHAKFSHARHEVGLLRCTDCHYKREPPASEKLHAMPSSPESRGPHSIYRSRQAADLLLPSISVCRECHGEQAASASGGAARTDCVTCHSYHHVLPPP